MRQNSEKPLLSTRVVIATMSAAAMMSNAQAETGAWTPERTSAVVRLEVPQEGRPGLSIGTGFIIKGLNNNRFFVLTATHVALPEYGGDQLPTGCRPLLHGTKLRQGNAGGPE